MFYSLTSFIMIPPWIHQLHLSFQLV